MRSMFVTVTDDRDRAATGGTSEGAERDETIVHAVAPQPTTDFERFCACEHRRLARALGMALDDTELGRDAAAEGLTRAWAHWSSVSTMDNPTGWVYRVGLNWARSRLRKRRREVTTAFPPERARPSGPIDGYDDGVAAALARLSTEHRAVVVARYYLDWSEATTAAALDIPPGTVKSRLSRALDHLDHDLRSDT